MLAYNIINMSEDLYLDTDSPVTEMQVGGSIMELFGGSKDNEYYKRKYLKYKSKYLNVKNSNMHGGALSMKAQMKEREDRLRQERFKLQERLSKGEVHNEEKEIQPEKVNDNPYYIYTTAIGFTTQEKYRIIDKWELLLYNIIQKIPAKFNKINVIHYSPPSDGIENSIGKDELSTLTKKIDEKVIGTNRFTSTLYYTVVPIDLIPQKPNILIDFAHLVSYALTNQKGSYSGYNSDYLKQFNYIYLPFDFVMDPAENLDNIHLFTINDDDLITTIHCALHKLDIIKLYDDGNLDMNTVLQKYISKIRREGGKRSDGTQLKFGDEYNYTEKLDVVWEKYNELSEDIKNKLC
jgi:hypothetical protein